jgi:hypothetical protein
MKYILDFFCKFIKKIGTILSQEFTNIEGPSPEKKG